MDMTHSATSRKVAFIASAALVGTAFAAAPAAAQDLNVCDGEFETPVTLRVSVHTGTNPGAWFDQAEYFNAEVGPDLGITVELVPIGETAYETSIVSAAAAADLPDIISMDGPFLYNFAWNGFLRAVDSCISDEKRDSFLPSIIQQGTYQDGLYSLGSFDSGLGLWAHKSMIEEVGARIPTGPDDAWTAEEFTGLLKALKDAGKGANGPLDIKWWYGAGEWRPYGFAPMIQSAGGDIIDRSTMASVDGFFNGPEAVGAWTTFQGWVNDGLIDLAAEDDNNFMLGPDGTAGTGDETPISWVGHWMYDNYLEALGDDLILLPLPDFGNGSKTGMGSWNWAVSTGPDGVAASGDEVDLDAAWAWVDFVTSPEEIDRLSSGETAVPSTKDALAASEVHQEGGDMAMYITNLNNAHTDTTEVKSGAVPRPATPAYGAIRSGFSDGMADIIAGADVQSTLDEYARRIDQEIEDAGYAE
jgi:multiple sugar transport system substrate-binding protein